MEHYYMGYTKVLDNKTYYFVKKYIVFPELKNIPPVLETYGMHTDFNKACSIALITDPVIKQRILNQIESNTQQAKVIDLNNNEIIKKAR
jgi:hypothetical protein